MPHDAEFADHLFHEAFKCVTQQEKHALLTAACGKNAAMWNTVWDRLQNESKVISAARQTGALKGRTVPLPTTLAHEHPNDLVGPCRLVRPLGEGGSSVVWLAEDAHTAAPVAIKIIQTGAQSFLPRFERQMPQLARLDHPCIAKPLECGTTNSGKPYIITELLRGTPVTQFCDDQRLPLLARVELFLVVCEALHHAHLKGVVHGGIKPGNILLQRGAKERPVVKIVDFGVAQALDHALASPEGILLAPAAYFSPEHARADAVEAHSDIYAMGVLLHELLVGRLPLEKETACASLEELMRYVRDAAPMKPSACFSSLPEAQRSGIALNRQMEQGKMKSALEYQFDWIVMKALEKQPQARQANLGAMMNDLRQHLTLDVAEGGKSSVPGTHGRRLRSTWSLVQLAALVVITLVAAYLLTQWFVAKREDGGRQAAVGAFRQAHFDGIEGLPREQQKALLKKASAHLNELSQHPAAAADVQEEIGLTYMVMEESGDAQSQFEAALEKRQMALGPDHPDTLRTVTDLATAQHVQGQHVEAEKRLRPTFEKQREVLGLEHPDTRVTIRVLAAVCEAENKQMDAATLYLQLYQVQKKVLGTDHLETLATLGDAARACAEQEHHEEAIKLQREHLEGMRRAHGDRDPKTFVSMSFTAATLEAGGRHEEAEKMLLTAMRGMQEVLGADHPETQARSEELAAMHARRRRFEEAIKLRELLVEAKQRLLGRAHPDTLLAFNLLAAEYEAAGRHSDAMGTRLRILEILRSTLGHEHPDTLACMEEMARRHSSQGSHAEALRLQEQVLAIRQRRLGIHALQTHRTMHQVAMACDAAGMTAEAEALQLRALSLSREAFGAGDPDTLFQMRSTAALYQKHGRGSEAETIYTEMLRIQESVFGPEHEETLETLNGLAATLQQQGRIQDAEDLYFRVLNQRTQEGQPLQARVAAMLNLGSCRLLAGKPDEAAVLFQEGLQLQIKHAPDHWTRFHTESLLGAAKLAQKKPAEAGRLLRAGFEGLNDRHTGASPVDEGPLRDSISRLVTFYESTGNLAEATHWQKQMSHLDTGGPP